MISPGTVSPGDFLIHAPSGVRVKLLSNVDGAVATVRLPSGQAMQYPVRDLREGFSAENVDSSKGPQIDPRGGSDVGTGPVGAKVTGAEFAKRVLLEGFRRAHPAVGSIIDNYGTVVHREPLGPGTVLIKASNGRPVTVISTAPERGLFVCKLENGALEVLTSDELLTGDRQPLAKAAGTLRKGAKLKRGTRVRVTKTGREGKVMTDGHATSSVVEFENGSMAAIPNQDLTII